MAGGYGHTLILTAPHLMMASVSVSPNKIVGGTGTTGTVTLTGTAGGGRVRVYLSCDSILATVPAYVDVPAGSNTATFPISTYGVGTQTAVHIYAQHYNYVTATLTLTP
jgi:hypothetical protein